jgi:hypothetical protein
MLKNHSPKLKVVTWCLKIPIWCALFFDWFSSYLISLHVNIQTLLFIIFGVTLNCIFKSLCNFVSNHGALSFISGQRCGCCNHGWGLSSIRIFLFIKLMSRTLCRMFYDECIFQTQLILLLIQWRHKKTEFEANQSPQGRQAWQTFEAQRSCRSPAPGEESYLSARRQQRQRAEIYSVRWACSLRSRRQVDRHAIVFCSYFSTTRRFEFYYQINWNQVCHVISVSHCHLLSLSLTVFEWIWGWTRMTHEQIYIDALMNIFWFKFSTTK